MEFIKEINIESNLYINLTFSNENSDKIYEINTIENILSKGIVLPNFSNNTLTLKHVENDNNINFNEIKKNKFLFFNRNKTYKKIINTYNESEVKLLSNFKFTKSNNQTIIKFEFGDLIFNNPIYDIKYSDNILIIKNNKYHITDIKDSLLNNLNIINKIYFSGLKNFNGIFFKKEAVNIKIFKNSILKNNLTLNLNNNIKFNNFKNENEDLELTINLNNQNISNIDFNNDKYKKISLISNSIKSFDIHFSNINSYSSHIHFKNVIANISFQNFVSQYSNIDLKVIGNVLFENTDIHYLSLKSFGSIAHVTFNKLNCHIENVKTNLNKNIGSISCLNFV